MTRTKSTNSVKPVEEKSVDRQRFRRFFLLHLKPTRVPRCALKYTHTFGLGGSAAVLFGLLALTGLLLMLVYEGSPERAYDSVVSLHTEFRFGGLVRNIHYWSGNLLLVLIGLHLLRVYFTGAFHPPRQFNWLVGLCILLGVAPFLLINWTFESLDKILQPILELL